MERKSRRVERPQRAGVVVVVVTAGPTGGATVVVCWVVAAGLGCSTRSDLTEHADVAASRKIKMDTRMSKASLESARAVVAARSRVLKTPTFSMVARDND
jgi:hypothetical protein